ncbi:putative 3',5'-cyclic-nucleotide phosphodiesterase [Podospora fimiseda]|uniref:3',5'-cyclic-nucleotide phosphodiesterase n=1 Tax=Podospora fimiseda TaxID=252190 RepID=A0AAN7BLK9_9PEZI|nr:putative 3',5'-cyclic-nucleotide phosphodiesterase [Podospora fimiseda]
MGGGGGGEIAEAIDTSAAVDSSADGVATREPALHVIVLGSGGGPFENNVTSLLVRSISANWGKGSIVAVDAGVHLGAIRDILEQSQPKDLGTNDENPLPHTLTSGPFAGLEVRHANARLNASNISQDLVDTYLITHCHLDHIAGLVINTAGLRRPKRLAALPITIEGFKKHIFNNVIWPNLSDENNGHGLVTYMRLVEGGSPALGEGDTRGYLEIGDGIAVKALSVSHGHCIEKHLHRGSTSTRHPSFDASSLVPGGVADYKNSLLGLRSVNKSLGHLDPSSHNLTPFPPHYPPDRTSSLAAISRVNSMTDRYPVEESVCVYDSSAYFFQHIPTGREIIIFGDVEPDSESLTPRNQQVWQTAAPKIVAGKLAAIFIECSYDNSVTPDRLYGHLAPRYIQEEMTSLAKEVLAVKLAAAVPAVSSTPATRAGSTSEAAQQQGRRKSHPEFNSLASSNNNSADKKRKRVGVEEEEDVYGDDETSRGVAKRKTTPQPQHLRPLPACPGGDVSDAPVSPKTLRPGNRQSAGGQQETQDYFLPHTTTNRGSNSQSHTPHLATPTAELSLAEVDAGVLDAEKLEKEDDVDMSTSSPHPSGFDGDGPVTPLSIPQVVQHGHHDHDHHHENNKESNEQQSLKGILKGLKVVIIHVKEKLTDGPEAREVIQKELWAHEKESGLGVEYLVSRQGDSLFL